MDDIVPFLAMAGALAAIIGGLTWLASRARRRGVGRTVMGPVDEIYNPAAHRSHIEIQVQAERQVPMPSPDDRWRRSRGEADRPGPAGGS